MKLIITALIAALVLVPMVANANETPDFRAMAFEAGSTSNAQVQTPVRTKMDTAGRTLIGAAVGAVIGFTTCWLVSSINVFDGKTDDGGNYHPQGDDTTRLQHKTYWHWENAAFTGHGKRNALCSGVGAFAGGAIAMSKR